MIYPTGGGTGVLGIWKAWDELEALGLIGAQRPRMLCVQSEAMAPLVRAFDSGALDTTAQPGARTIAYGLNVPTHARRYSLNHCAQKMTTIRESLRESTNCAMANGVTLHQCSLHAIQVDSNGWNVTLHLEVQSPTQRAERVSHSIDLGCVIQVHDSLHTLRTCPKPPR